MKKSIIFFLFTIVIIFSFILYGCSEREDVLLENENSEEKDISTQLQELVDKHAEKYEFSASVLVAKDGKVLLSKGYGMGDYKNQILNKPDTIFEAGSITKQFTAAAIMLLQEKGVLNVQDTIDKYIPDYPEGNSIKIFNLLTNTSGISEHTDKIEDSRWSEVHTPEDIINIFKNKPLEFKPGEKFRYCNSNYVLLGYIIEKASGMKYEEYMRKSIFEPLDMKRTGFNLQSDSIDNIAIGYTSTKPTVKEAMYIDLSIPYAAGALQTTVEDLYKWDQALYTNKLLKEESIKEMFTPYLNNYAYGWIVSDGVVSHNGAIPGFKSHLKRDINNKYVIIVLNNSDVDTSNIIEPKINTLLKK